MNIYYFVCKNMIFYAIKEDCDGIFVYFQMEYVDFIYNFFKIYFKLNGNVFVFNTFLIF